MTDRYTRADVEVCAARLARLVGVEFWGSSNHHPPLSWSGWSVDHNAAYGGYVIAGHSAGSTGEARPLGDRRRSAREFCEAAWFAERVLLAREAVGSTS